MGQPQASRPSDCAMRATGTCVSASANGIIAFFLQLGPSCNTRQISHQQRVQMVCGKQFGADETDSKAHSISSQVSSVKGYGSLLQHPQRSVLTWLHVMPPKVCSQPWSWLCNGASPASVPAPKGVPEVASVALASLLLPVQSWNVASLFTGGMSPKKSSPPPAEPKQCWDQASSSVVSLLTTG